MKASSLGGLLAVAVLACSAGAGAAEAQTCTIKAAAGYAEHDPNGLWSGFSEGQVVAFGDLKVRANAFGPTYEAGPSNTWTSDWANVGVKAPGFELRGLVLQRRVPKVLTICGQEVTLTYFGNPTQYMITVGVF